MSSPEPSAGAVAVALAGWARAKPEAPFLFYRSVKGHFGWWSFREAFAWLERPGRTGDVFSEKEGLPAPDGVELLEPFLIRAVGVGSGSPEIVDLDRGGERDVWISWRPLTHPAELALARWAIVAGAAILVEPGPRLHPELFAWARPTLASGSAAELLALADELERLAPRFLRRRWFRQRGGRLRFLLVELEPSALELQQVTLRWRQLAPQATIDAFRCAQQILPGALRQGAE